MEMAAACHKRCPQMWVGMVRSERRAGSVGQVSVYLGSRTVGCWPENAAQTCDPAPLEQKCSDDQGVLYHAKGCDRSSLPLSPKHLKSSHVVYAVTGMFHELFSHPQWWGTKLL